jgi:hypothetical protein
VQWIQFIYEIDHFLQPTQRRDPSGQINAFTAGSKCLQPEASTGTSEDCLFLNIFTPKVRILCSFNETEIGIKLRGENQFGLDWEEKRTEKGINCSSVLFLINKFIPARF